MPCAMPSPGIRSRQIPGRGNTRYMMTALFQKSSLARTHKKIRAHSWFAARMYSDQKTRKNRCRRLKRIGFFYIHDILITKSNLKELSFFRQNFDWTHSSRHFISHTSQFQKPHLKHILSIHAGCFRNMYLKKLTSHGTHLFRRIYSCPCDDKARAALF